MNFGTWTQQEIKKVLNKIEHHYYVHENLKNECIKLSDNLYKKYLINHESKSSFFRIIKTKVLSKEDFFDRTCAYNIDGVRIHRDNEYIKKHDVSYNDAELKVLHAFLEGYFKYDLNKEIRKLKERLTYCVGGDISDDEIYLLCDMDNLTTSYQNALNHTHFKSEELA